LLDALLDTLLGDLLVALRSSRSARNQSSRSLPTPPPRST
jgi:hypothetical protein